MKKYLLYIIVGFLFLGACKNKNVSKESNLTVEGKIKGLRLGTLVLKKLDRDSIVSVDSIKVNGNEAFVMDTHIDAPQELLLELPEIQDGKILFFAAPGDTIKIYTFLDNFGVNPVIEGGKNQAKLNEYQEMMKKFTDKELDLFKQRFDASKEGNKKLADSLEEVTRRIQKKKQLYKLNFIFTNKDLPIASYIALTNFYNNKKALDTIYKVLDEPVMKGKYGKEIKKSLEK